MAGFTTSRLSQQDLMQLSKLLGAEAVAVIAQSPTLQLQLCRLRSKGIAVLPTRYTNRADVEKRSIWINKKTETIRLLVDLAWFGFDVDNSLTLYKMVGQMPREQFINTYVHNYVCTMRCTVRVIGELFAIMYPADQDSWTVPEPLRPWLVWRDFIEVANTDTQVEHLDKPYPRKGTGRGPRKHETVSQYAGRLFDELSAK